MGVRRAGKAGSWYAGTAAGLAAEVDGCLEEAGRRYGLAEPTPGTRPVAAVVPHAGLAYSGPIAALVFRLIREAYERVDAFVVFGASHRALLSRPAVWDKGAWETPLGRIDIDEDLAARLVEAGVAVSGEGTHAGDNAIELQTPFIRRMFPESKFVPVAMSPLPGAGRVGEAARTVAQERGGTVVAVASTDLTHYGAAFGVTPAGTGPQAVEWTRRNDERFLDALAGLELENIVTVAEHDGSACGAGAAAAAAGWARAAGVARGRLLAHANSYEIMPRGSADHMVGYAGMVFEAAVGAADNADGG